MKNLFALILLCSLVFGSCKKEEIQSDQCSSFTTVGKATVNGVEENLVTGQFVASQGTYTFQLATVSTDCSVQKIVSLTLLKSSAGILTGTYPIKDFFDVDNNEVSGSFVSQKLNPISQSLEDFVSGTVTITEHGTKDYTIDVTAKSAVSPSIKFKTRFKF